MDGTHDIEATGQAGGWPVGFHDIPHTDVPDHLLNVAALHARRAVLGRAADDLLELLDSATSAGVAVELIAKAAIARIEPALLAAPPTRSGTAVRSVLYLRGHREYVSGSPIDEVSTITARTAIQTVLELHSGSTPPPKAVAHVLDVRNAAAHLGIVDKTKLVDAVNAMAVYVNQVLVALAEDTVAFWGPQVNELVLALLDKRSDELGRAVKELIARAGAEYNRRYAGLESTGRATILAAVSAIRPSWGEDAVREPCPACEQEGWLVIDVDQDVEPVGGGQYEAGPEYPYIAGFECPVCGLSLDLEMLELAGIDPEAHWDSFYES